MAIVVGGMSLYALIIMMILGFFAVGTAMDDEEPWDKE